jgi:uncharacterized protein
MGYQSIQLKLPTGYSDQELKQRIASKLGLSEFSFQIENKSLDARQKADIHWLIRLMVHSQEIQGSEYKEKAKLDIPYKKRDKKVVVTGSGPAGFFAAYVLQKAGFQTVLIERGADVTSRATGIQHFEKTGEFSPVANYSFGEGGAGTFSDGKLTSRSKHISLERQFVLSSYVEAGAPSEILFMSHPHVGSDNLKIIVRNLRESFKSLGGEMLFETTLNDISVEQGTVLEGVTSNDLISGDYFIIAPGHSSYDTYRMLMSKGVAFRTKNFAIGSRAEHLQSDINLAQWGIEKLPGVKAAEYRLTSEADGLHPVYSFCMCPGGMVVPAAAYKDINIVNGMSNYQRNASFANAACVAGIHPDELAGRKVTPLEALTWLENLEHSFFDFSKGYQAPFCTIDDFISGKVPEKIPETSYPLGLIPAPLWEMLPAQVTHSMREGLKDFNRKLKGYEKGVLLGLESKTSSPIQVLREANGLCSGFSNLFVAGEGSGYAGGIISSASDGIKVALQIIER